MSEVIEDYIRRNATLTEADAFQGFLQQDRIRTWVGADEGRKERLRREFTRVWAEMHHLTSARAGPAGPATGASTAATAVHAPSPAPPVHAPAAHAPPAPIVREEPRPAKLRVDAPTAPAVHSGGRRLQLLCSACGRMDVWNTNGNVHCRACGRAYHDLLELIPVQPVGPFEFLFGEGAQGWLTATGIVLLLLLLYGVLRWV